MENVKALTQKKFLPYLHKWHSFLTEMGYTNFTQILNSKNFGVPQNRERVFMVSILGDAWFDFPKPFQSDKKLKDLLYEPINNKYFRIRKLTEKECFRLMDVSDENINKIQNSGISKTQQYKMAGNSIVVNVLYFIFKNLFKQ